MQVASEVRAPWGCALDLHGLVNSCGCPLANSPRCVKRGLWLMMYMLVRLGVTVRNVTYSRRKQGGGEGCSQVT